MNKSIWNEYLKEKDYPTLNEDLNVDVLVIGGGIVGITTLRKLHDHNINAVLVEKNTIGNGTTSKTTAFLTTQHETLYQDLTIHQAKEYLKLNNSALEEYIKLAKRYDFDFEHCYSTLFSNNEKKIKKEYSTLKTLNQDVELTNQIPFIKDNIGISFNNQAIINPIKLLYSLTKDLNIYEHTEVIKLYKNHAVLKNNKIIKFNKVVIATNYPINNKLNLLFMKLTKRKSYVIVIKNEIIKGTYCSLDTNGMYFRMYKDYLIIGGYDTKTGYSCLNKFKNKVLEQFKITEDDIIYLWSGMDTISIDGIPYIGYSDIFHKNHIIITGFNLWGFTWSLAAADIVLKIIKENKDCKLTRLNRFCINKNLFNNIITSFKNLLVFRKPKCTHLGCALIYNKEEQLFECPCHGSIYNKEEEVIIGPAKTNIK